MLLRSDADTLSDVWIVVLPAWVYIHALLSAINESLVERFALRNGLHNSVLQGHKANGPLSKTGAAEAEDIAKRTIKDRSMPLKIVKQRGSAKLSTFPFPRSLFPKTQGSLSVFLSFSSSSSLSQSPFLSVPFLPFAATPFHFNCLGGTTHLPGLCLKASKMASTSS